jgi:hypothetical protein
VSDRRNVTGTRIRASAQFTRLLDVEGVEGEGTLPRMMAICSFLSHGPGLVVVRGSRANVRDEERRTDQDEPIRS